MDVFDMLYPDLTSTLENKHPEMNDLERKVFLLSRLKLSRVEESTLLGISTSVLDKVRGRVRRMMDGT